MTQEKDGKIIVKGLSGIVVGEYLPLPEHSLRNFQSIPCTISDDPHEDHHEKYPYAPIILGTNGYDYIHGLCQTEDQAIQMIHEGAFYGEVVFAFLGINGVIKKGWYLDTSQCSE